MFQLTTLATSASESHVAGPGVVAAICVGLTLFGLALILDLGSLRTRWVESKMQQYRDFPWLGKVFSEPREEDERRIQHRVLIIGGFAAIGMAVWLISIVNG